jgi:hypothetical protein
MAISTEKILLVSSLFISIYALVFMLLSYRRIKKIRNGVMERQINLQRDLIERKIYNWQNLLTDDPTQLYDSNKLLLNFASNSNDIFSKVPNDSFFTSLGIDFEQYNVRENTLFCLMPFNKAFNKVYEAIKRGCSLQSFECHRSDETLITGNLLRQIVISIITSKFVIAVLDGRNSNVFYEIGIAHAIGKPVFLVANYNQMDQLPFDIKSSRLILYKNEKDLEAKISKAITENTKNNES